MGVLAPAVAPGTITPQEGITYLCRGTIYPMALNIKDGEVDRLAEELAQRMGHGNKTQAIRDALRNQLELTRHRAEERADEILEVMRTEIWPLLPDRTPITKREREEILGTTT